MDVLVEQLRHQPFIMMTVVVCSVVSCFAVQLSRRDMVTAKKVVSIQAAIMVAIAILSFASNALETAIISKPRFSVNDPYLFALAYGSSALLVAIVCLDIYILARLAVRKAV